MFFNSTLTQPHIHFISWTLVLRHLKGSLCSFSYSTEAVISTSTNVRKEGVWFIDKFCSESLLIVLLGKYWRDTCVSSEGSTYFCLLSPHRSMWLCMKQPPNYSVELSHHVCPTVGTLWLWCLKSVPAKNPLPQAVPPGTLASWAVTRKFGVGQGIECCSFFLSLPT